MSVPLERELFGDDGTEPYLTAGRLVLLAACDSAYVPHAVTLIKSVETFSPGQTIILYLVNPSEADLERMEVLRHGLKWTRLVLSGERINLSLIPLVQRKTYYACVRFVRLAELMQVAACDFLVLDADSLVVAPIERDFSDKPEAEVCLRRRDLQTQIPEHLAVAAGSVWARSTPGARRFFESAAADIHAAFADGSAIWHLDQIVLKRVIDNRPACAEVRNIKSKYADWDFRDDSVVWQGKGKRKYLDIRYLLLQGGLSDDRYRVQRSKRLYDEFVGFIDRTSKTALDRRLSLLLATKPYRVVFLLPRLDLPWKQQGVGKDGPPRLRADTLELRLNWVRFVSQLANACERVGLHVEIQEVPAWEITRAYVESLGAALVLVPHRCKIDFDQGQTPILFYMQEYFRWLFVVDEQGWGAASSIYPVQQAPASLPPTGAFREYRRRLECGELESKFAQQPWKGRLQAQIPSLGGATEDAAREASTMPLSVFEWMRRVFGGRAKPVKLHASMSKNERRPSVFFPLQIRHDHSIRYFSDYGFDEILNAVVRWASDAGVALTLKAHPANMPLMAEYIEKYPPGPLLKWSNDNIHDLIAESDAVFTVNSGVGFEALLHGKPVVTFGRAEYDCVTIHASIDTVESAWQECVSQQLQDRERRYQAFFDWFTTTYAVDLSRPDAASMRLAELAARIVAIAYAVDRDKAEVAVP